MAVAINTKQEADVLEMILAGPKLPVGGVVSEVGENVARISDIGRAVVGKMKLAGFSFAEILSVVFVIGKFIAEHGDDIEAIWKAILALFPNKGG